MNILPFLSLPLRKIFSEIFGISDLTIILGRERSVLMSGDRFLDIDSGREDEYLNAPSQHYTFVFNVLVMMILFNEINCRRIDGSINVFSGLHRSRMFIGIWTVSVILQVYQLNNVISTIRDLYIQGGPAKVRPTYIFDGNGWQVTLCDPMACDFP